jgi:hypothetical protein
MFSRAPNLKQISQRKLWGVSLSLLSFLRSIKKMKMCKILSTPDVRLTSNTKNAALKTHFYVTSTKIVAVKVDNSVVNLMVPCQKKVE